MHDVGSALPRWRRWGSAVVILIGAAVYALLEWAGLVDFSATPLILGFIAILAGLVGVRRRVVATGLVLAGWGAMVLLVAEGVVPADRTAPAYMLGVGIGLLLAAAAAPRRERGDWLTSGSVAAFTGPLSLYAASDVAGLGRWPVWAVVLIGWSAWEAFWTWREVRASALGGSGREAASSVG